MDDYRLPEQGTSFFGVMACIVVFVLSLLFQGRGCTVESYRATNALTVSGYTNATVVDRSNFWVAFNGCDESDAVAFDCVAKNSQGQRVRLKVCCGAIIKSCTVRVP